MTDQEALAERLRALQSAREATSPPSAPITASVASPSASKKSGPAPGRILAAAASVSAGFGLIALMAGAQQDVVVQVNPTPISVQPAQIVVEMLPGNGTDPTQIGVRAVEAAAPAERAVPQARAVTQSEGS